MAQLRVKEGEISTIWASSIRLLESLIVPFGSLLATLAFTPSAWYLFLPATLCVLTGLSDLHWTQQEILQAASPGAQLRASQILWANDSNRKQLQLLGATQWFEETLKKQASELTLPARRYGIYSNLTFVVTQLLYLGTLILLLINETGRANPTAGISALLMASGIIFGSMLGLRENLSEVARVTTLVGLYTNLFKCLHQNQTEPAHQLQPPLEKLELKNLSYQYPGHEVPALNDLSFTIEAGETIALVGENGSGKTTLLKILLGLYQPTSGRLLAHYSGGTLAENPAANDQATGTHQGSPYYRVSLLEEIQAGAGSIEGQLKGSYETAKQAAVQYGLDCELRKRGTQKLGGHSQLSGGQKQKLALARADLGLPAPIIFFDEPGAALDPLAETEVMNHTLTMAKASQDIAIFVTHRLSYALQADRVFILEKGKLVEQGTPPDLLESSGRFAHLYALQSKGY
ncbi:hypothetical protein BSR29_07280 [Boudabousia liubingyangii]|uniref:ABC transporter domain-containing protein n=1 Tax=Boudabousia liubingyangii TaxID=1921764 RepID=A0A1Q5PK61_9ACTO|nr:ATP-binding cassette domain-containing protein [Boudabousia liubingyangii]OKL46615.1 hypothetical protein BSR29_07280 [Boudabousia liubingyangii]OKL46796.1 hypothetical protein BSR28_04985 [Boudabousia liubingyangii]